MTWLLSLPFIVASTIIASGLGLAFLFGRGGVVKAGGLLLEGKAPLTRKVAKLLSIATGASVVLLSSFAFWLDGIEGAFIMGLGVLGLAIMLLAPVFFVVSAIADGGRAVKGAIEERRVIRTRTKDRRAGQLSTAAPEQERGRLSEAASSGQMSLR